MSTDCTVYPVRQATEILVSAVERQLTSIIVTASDITRVQRQITSACLGNINKFTDREDYELILVDQSMSGDLDDRHNVIDIDHWLKMEPVGQSRAMNLGYKASKGHYLCFIHNDVFVNEGWLPILKGIFEKMKAPVTPMQGRIPREAIKLASSEDSNSANDDAGLWFMTREMFEKTGGWDERFKLAYQDAVFRLRFPVRYVCTNQCVITHIGAVTMYADEKREEESYTEEGPLYNDLINNGTGKAINYLL